MKTNRAYQCLIRQKPINNPVCEFIKKKESEGKPKKVAKISGNKFIHIYYTRVSDVYLLKTDVYKRVLFFRKEFLVPY